MSLGAAVRAPAAVRRGRRGLDVARRAGRLARRFQARVIVHASAVDLAARIGPWVGTVTAVDERSCILETGADSLESLAVYLGLLGIDFTVDGPPELVAGVQALAARYGRATVGSSQPGPAVSGS